MMPQGIAALTPQERFDLLTDLWDSLAAEGVMLTPAQKAALAQRAAALGTRMMNWNGPSRYWPRPSPRSNAARVCGSANSRRVSTLKSNRAHSRDKSALLQN